MRNILSALRIITIICMLFIAKLSFGGTMYYAYDKTYSAPPLGCAAMDYGHCSGIKFGERYWKWEYSETYPDPNPRFEVACDIISGDHCNCPAESYENDVDVTNSVENKHTVSIEFSGEITWSPIKEVLELGAGYTYTSSDEFTQGTEITVPVHLKGEFPEDCYSTLYANWTIWTTYVQGPLTIYCNYIYPDDCGHGDEYDGGTGKAAKSTRSMDQDLKARIAEHCPNGHY